MFLVDRPLYDSCQVFNWVSIAFLNNRSIRSKLQTASDCLKHIYLFDFAWYPVSLITQIVFNYSLFNIESVNTDLR